jgi:hypothetical protein
MGDRLGAVQIRFAPLQLGVLCARSWLNRSHFIDPAAIRANQMGDQQQRHRDAGHLDEGVHQDRRRRVGQQGPDKSANRKATITIAVRAEATRAVRVPSSQPPVSISRG